MDVMKENLEKTWARRHDRWDEWVAVTVVFGALGALLLTGGGIGIVAIVVIGGVFLVGALAVVFRGD
jgi:hypothetical protein